MDDPKCGDGGGGGGDGANAENGGSRSGANAERLAALKAAAESQMRRPAPAIGSGSKKRQRQAGSGDNNDADDADDEDKEEAAAAARFVARFDYGGADALVAPNGGARGLIVTCRLRRQMSATREAHGLLAPRLPAGACCSLVKVGTPGVVVMLVRSGGNGGVSNAPAAAAPEAAAPAAAPAAASEAAAAAAPAATAAAAADVISIATGILADVESGALPRARFAERIVPFEATCALSDAAAIRAAADAVCGACVAWRRAGGGGAAPLEFAVAYKNREFERGSGGGGAASGGASGQQQQQEEEDAGNQATTTTTSAHHQHQQLPRGEVIAILAAAMSAAAGSAGLAARVNLSKPQVTLLAEVLPVLISGRWTAVLGLAAVDTQALVATGRGRGLQVRTLTATAATPKQPKKQR